MPGINKHINLVTSNIQESNDQRQEKRNVNSAKVLRSSRLKTFLSDETTAAKLLDLR